MKFLFLVFFFNQISFARDIQTTQAFPTEGSEVVPDIVKEESEVKDVVEEASPLPEEGKKTEVVKFQKIETSEDLREDSTGTIAIGYQLITSWLPSKKTLSYTHIFDKKWSLEFEYAWATLDFPVYGVDLGEIKEKRYTLQARRYFGNSFHFSFGPVLNEFKARLGGDILDTLGAEIKSSFEVQNLGVSGGIGNRWQWKNGITFGVDWIRINVPVVETKLEDNVLEDIPSEGDQEDIKTVIRTINRIPTFVLFGLNLGYTF